MSHLGVQGNCTGPPPEFALPAAVPDLALASGQCVIVSDRTILVVSEADQNLWVDNVLLRVARTRPDQVCHHISHHTCSHLPPHLPSHLLTPTRALAAMREAFCVCDASGSLQCQCMVGATSCRKVNATRLLQGGQPDSVVRRLQSCGGWMGRRL